MTILWKKMILKKLIKNLLAQRKVSILIYADVVKNIIKNNIN
jgi:hypothetical protein